MLMICGFRCAPSRKGVAGAEIAIPGCKIKFELRSVKKIRRNTTSISGKTTSQPKLYSFVRLSFMPTRKIVDLMVATSFSRGWESLSRLLETNDASERFGIFQHVHDFDSRPFHLMEHGIHARGKITVGDESRRRDDEASRSRKQTLINAAGKFGDRRVTAMGRNHSESVDHSRNCAE